MDHSVILIKSTKIYKKNHKEYNQMFININDEFFILYVKNFFFHPISACNTDQINIQF